MKKNVSLEERQVEMQKRWEGVEEPSRILWRYRKVKKIVPKSDPAVCRWNLNASEQRVLDMLLSEGHPQVIRNGWPDFGVVMGGKLIGIEVKKANDSLRLDQIHAHKLLKTAGIEVFVVKDEGHLSILKQIRSHFAKEKT